MIGNIVGRLHSCNFGSETYETQHKKVKGVTAENSHSSPLSVKYVISNQLLIGIFRPILRMHSPVSHKTQIRLKRGITSLTRLSK